ncbi:MAG TPA: type II secretion system F family protein [Vicinamibacterales bacterium]|nr:type II secretion system F family protein [Vicinamibacterales bacterium]
MSLEFRCRIASPNGEIIEGVYVAESAAKLRRELEDKGLYVLSMHAKGAVAGISLPMPGSRRVSNREFLVFNQELATLLKAGMPLVQSLDLLKRRVTSAVFRSVLDDVHEQVRSGAALSDAFAAQGELFPRVYTASLLAGERSGNLDAVLRRYVDYAKVIATLKRKIVSALVYPAILIVFSLVLVSIIVLNVVPAFADFYAGFGAELPLATRVIMQISAFVRAQFVWVILGLVVLGASFAFWIRQAGEQARFDHLTLRLPGLGPVARKFGTSQMARTLATLLGGGLPLVNALDIAARSVGNRYLAGQLDIVAARVREGQSFAAALDARRAFPDVAVKMAEVGEATGALQEMLNTVADFFDEEISTHLERFVTLVEPVLLIIMGIVIAGLLLALYMPLFQLSSVLS